MKIEILRGKEHIGGNIIKITAGETVILLDCGAMLPKIGEEKREDDFDISSIGRVDAVFLSHHHGDHSGLIEKLPKETALYASPETVGFMDHCDLYLGKNLRTGKRAVHGLFDNERVQVGSLFVTPFRAKHSAEGAMMFLVEGEGKRILYTGDFKESDLYAGKLDLLITEGTMLTRDGGPYRDEDDVEAALRRLMRKTQGRIFVLTSSANIGRIRSVIGARNAVCPDRIGYPYLSGEGETPRPIMQDVFLKYTLENTGHSDLAAPYAFISHKFDTAADQAYDRIAKHYCDTGTAASCRRIAAFSRAVVFIRASMTSMLQRLMEGGMDVSEDVLVFSMWRGYEEDNVVKRLVDLFKDRGAKIEYVHSGGHAERETLRAFIENCRPKNVVCIHSENAENIRSIAGEARVLEESVIEL
ncbi:MAG: MBL fold metallo-hydrolase [Clostridiales bacterium]|nr:MBL fold metallo-hydrolase [Clostridiales bacterium]